MPGQRNTIIKHLHLFSISIVFVFEGRYLKFKFRGAGAQLLGTEYEDNINQQNGSSKLNNFGKSVEKINSNFHKDRMWAKRSRKVFNLSWLFWFDLCSICCHNGKMPTCYWSNLNLPLMSSIPSINLWSCVQKSIKCKATRSWILFQNKK